MESRWQGANAPLLEIRGVQFAFPDGPTVVESLNLIVRRGEIVCLLGPSGCGKTTTLRLIAGLEQPLAGEILLDGEQVASANRSVAPERRGIGMVFQSDALFPHLTIAQNVGFGLNGSSATQRQQEIDQALLRVGLDGYANMMPHKLSGGQRQRTSLARALIRRPRIVLLDEAFASLDTRLREQTRDDTLHLLKEQSATAILVTHDPEEAMFMADRIVLLRGGRVEQIGTPSEIYFSPRTIFAAEFLGEMNRIESLVRNNQVDTELGVFDAPDMADGQRAVVLIRSEGVVPCQDGPISALVEASHLLGRSMLLHLSVGGSKVGRRALHIHARAGVHDAPRTGDQISIRVDRRLAFVLADDHS